MMLASSSLQEDSLEASLGPLRASWAILEPAWAVLGSLEAILAVLETSSSRLGSHLGHLGRLGGVLEASWSPSWQSWIGKGIDPGIFGIDPGSFLWTLRLFGVFPVDSG